MSFSKKERVLTQIFLNFKKYKHIYWFIVLGIVFIICNFVFVCLNNNHKIAQFGQIGDGFGGVLNPIFALAGLVFIVISLKEQRDAFSKTIKLQRKQSAMEALIPSLINSVENIKIHIEDVNGDIKIDRDSQFFFYQFYWDLNKIYKRAGDKINNAVFEEFRNLREWFDVVEVENVVFRYKELLLYVDENELDNISSLFASLPYYFHFYCFCYFLYKDYENDNVLKLLEKYQMYEAIPRRTFANQVIHFLQDKDMQNVCKEKS